MFFKYVSKLDKRVGNDISAYYLLVAKVIRASGTNVLVYVEQNCFI